MEHITLVLYGVAGLLTTAAAFFMFGSYISAGKVVIGRLSLIFLLIGVHAFSFVLPIIFSPQNEDMIHLGYLIGVACIFLVFIVGFDVQRFMTHGIITKKQVLFFSILFEILAVATIILMLLEPRTPVFYDYGVILWNLNPAVGWVIGLTSLAYGIIWGVVFYKGAFLVSSLQSRFKLLIISVDGYLLGLTAFMAFTSSTVLQTFLSNILFVLVGLVTICIYIIPKKFFIIGDEVSN